MIDTHAHYDSSRFAEDRHALISALPANGVERVINIGCDMKTSQAAVALAAEYEHVYATVGFHPHYVKDLTEEQLPALLALCGNKKVVGFGEIGLDFFHNFSPKNIQRHWFRELLGVVEKLGLPAIIHSREAADEVFSMIKASQVRKGVIHAFSGDAALALEYVNLGFHIGIGGVVTFKKTDELKAAVAAVPLEKILLETDCPYLAPEPFRGKRNDSTLLTYVAAEIAKIKGDTAEAVIAQTSDNAKKLFHLS
jgi:TatD DNase family protein